MQHLRQVLAITFLVSLLGGCSYTRHWAPEACPVQQSEKLSPQPQPEAEAATEPAMPKYQPIVYRLDKHRTLEIWDTEAHGHFTFLKNGKRIRTEPLLYCTAEPLLPEDGASSPAIRLDGTKSQFVVVRQQADDHYLHTVFRLGSKFPKVGSFESKSPLSLVEIGGIYRFSGEDYLPGGGAHQFAPNILFKFVKGKLKFDRESMRKKLPTQKELCNLERDIRSKFKQPNDIPVELYDTLFAFYYCGEVKRAKQFFNSVYPKNLGQSTSERMSYLQFVKDQIAQSPYRKEIER